MFKVFLGLCISQILMWKVCTATGYDIRGTHLDESNTVDSKHPLQDHVSIWIEEVKQLWARHDAENIANKFSEDAMFIRQGLEIQKGRKNISQAFQSRFDAGVDRISVENVRMEQICEDFVLYVAHSTEYDKDDEPLEVNTNLVILKKVEDGFQVILRSQTVD